MWYKKDKHKSSVATPECSFVCLFLPDDIVCIEMPRVSDQKRSIVYPRSRRTITIAAHTFTIVGSATNTQQPSEFVFDSNVGQHSRMSAVYAYCLLFPWKQIISSWTKRHGDHCILCSLLEFSHSIESTSERIKLAFVYSSHLRVWAGVCVCVCDGMKLINSTEYW